MSLSGVRVLVVEDESLIAAMLEDMLLDLGCEVAAMAHRMSDAARLAEDVQADLAILDVNVAGERIDPVALVLKRRGVPIIFATGYGDAGVGDDLRGAPVLVKPFDMRDLERALRAALGG